MRFLKFKKSFILFCLFFYLSPNVSFAYADHSCALSNGMVDEADVCAAKPISHFVYFTRIALCKESPGSPAPKLNLSSCLTIFESEYSSGFRTLVDSTPDSSPTILTGKPLPPFTEKDYGDYFYGYVEISPIMEASAVISFTSPRFNANKTSSGTACWSLTGTMMSVGSEDILTQCGNLADASPGLTTSIINSLGGPGILVERQFTSSKGDLIQAYLLNSSDTIASPSSGNLNDVSKVIGYLPQKITLTATTKQILIHYNNYQGVEVTQHPDGSIQHFAPGPFDIFITAQ